MDWFLYDKNLLHETVKCIWQKSNGTNALPFPQKSAISFNWLYFSKGLEKYKSKDDNILFLEDMNFEISENAINDWNVLS